MSHRDRTVIDSRTGSVDLATVGITPDVALDVTEVTSFGMGQVELVDSGDEISVSREVAAGVHVRSDR